MLELISHGIVSREAWGVRLRISRRTIYRWEICVIKKCFIKFPYWDGRKGKEGLDEYQRFVLLLIYFKKTIGITQSNKEVIEYFEEKDAEGRSRILSMKREQFYNFKNKEKRNAS
jgi:hypothetical protein